MALDIANFLSGVNGFNAISAEELPAIAEHVRTQTFKEGQHLIKRGDTGDVMYVLVTGRVRVPILDSSTGKTKIEVHLGPGDLVGEMALLTGERRNADVIAEGPVETLVIDRETLQPLLRDHPPLARFLTEILGKRLEEGGGIEWVGKYRLLGKLGEGATSKVYQGLHPALNRVVAIKMLSHALVYDSQFKDRFLQEARTIAGLTHPNIVQIFDTEACYATYFIVMEKVSGTDLSKLLKMRKVLAPAEAMDILKQVAAGLAYAHQQGIVHRDVKPANCALDEQGQVKLMDFGIARRIQKNPSEGRAKMVEGTPRYLAPEAAVGKPVDGRADIYSLGIMAYELVTGRVPFYSETIRELLQMHVRKRPPDIARIRSGLPEGLVTFINGSLEKRPEERLTDWQRIQSMLDPSGGPVADLRSSRREMSTEILSVSYSREAAGKVEAAVGALMRGLAALDGVEVSHARLVPVSLDAGDTADTASSGGGRSVDDTAESAAGPGDGNSADRPAAAGWLAKLTGSRKAATGEHEGHNPTRAMQTLDKIPKT
jgi:serine/threonine protein kinase